MLDRKNIIKLSAVFGLVYFFSSNGLASLPNITLNFLLKDGLHLTASQSAYFGAVTVLGWAIKPLWGFITDAFPIFGLRRKSYLLLTSALTALVWVLLSRQGEFTVLPLLIFFTLISALYSFTDVVIDALMVQRGKENNLTSQFQSVQWVASYVAAAIAGLAGGWVAAHLMPQQTFLITAIFPIIIFFAVLFLVKEEKICNGFEHSKDAFKAVWKAFAGGQLWLLGFFLFFIFFSPSFGAPFFYYAVDTLKFDQQYFGIVAMTTAITSALGALLYGFIGHKIRTKKFITWIIIISTFTTLFDLIYFWPTLIVHTQWSMGVFLVNNAILGALGAMTMLVVMNAAAISAPVLSEGVTFAFLTALINLGGIGSGILGGYLFDKIGLIPLIIVSTVFTAAALVFIPYLKIKDEELVVIGEDITIVP